MTWVRLESATIDPQLDEGLEARVADPAWLLARQWQSGEFRGEDAANPLLVQLTSRSVQVDRLAVGGRATTPIGAATPLEPIVEREAIRDGPSGTRVSAELGLILLSALARGRVARSVPEELCRRHPVPAPRPDELDPVGFRRLALLARRSFDGAALIAALTAAPDRLDQLLDELGLAGAARDRVGRIIGEWRDRVATVFHEPAGRPAWDATRMEYRFDLRASTDDVEVRLEADGYPGGRLEWYHFDRRDTAPPTEPASLATTRHAEVLPVPLRFRGMPASRFWAFEQGDVSFAAIDVAPEDLARVAVAGYATVYNDDWYVVPLRVPAATLTTIVSLRVIDDFGRTTDVPAAAVVDGGGPGRSFKFFELTGDPGPGRDAPPALFLPPSLETTDAGTPLEDVRFVRDEVGNLGWAVEHRIESRAGRPVDLAARDTSPLAAGTEPGAHPDDDRWRFVLSTPVRSHWIPLVPVRLGADGAIRLQRGRVPVAGGTTRGARGRILEPDRRLRIHEEEILRTGVRVVRRFQSARDAEGLLHTWVGRRKGPGRGEGTSGLSFDVLETD